MFSEFAIQNKDLQDLKYFWDVKVSYNVKFMTVLFVMILKNDYISVVRSGRISNFFVFTLVLSESYTAHGIMQYMFSFR